MNCYCINTVTSEDLYARRSFKGAKTNYEAKDTVEPLILAFESM